MYPCKKTSFGQFLVICLILAAPFAFGQTKSFTVTPSTGSLAIYPGQQNIPISVTVNSGDNDSDNYTGSVVVTMTGLPSGVTVTPVTLTPGSTGTMYLSATTAAGQEGFAPPTEGPSVVTQMWIAWTAQASIVGAAGSTKVTVPFPVTISISNPSFVPTTVNLPIVDIDTANVPVTSKTTDVPGTITITSADGQKSYLPNSSDSDNTATFHVHGNSTSAMPKLAYNIKLNTSLDLLNTMGLSCGYVSKGKAACDKSKTYILLANYDDKTLLRDWSASALANAIPIGGDYLNSPADSPTPSGTSQLMPWAPHSLFVELYLNGVYEGNYQLIEKVNVDSHRININEMAETDTSGDALTGGYQLEIDQENGEDYMFTTPQGVVVGLNDPDYTPEVPEQTTYITNYVDTAENALFASNFTDPTLGWRAYFDEASAVNFYIVNDLMGNVDGGKFYSSDYFYKDINNPLLYMGPIWDFDISSGNVNYDPIQNPTIPWMQTQAIWYKQWFTDPGFKQDVINQWNTLKDNGVFTTWIASIQQEAQSLEQSQANNFNRWPMLGIYVWPNNEAAGSYDGEVNFLTTWLNLRIAYLDSVFNNKTQTSTTFSVSGSGLRSGSSATLTAQVTGAASPTGSISFLANGAPLGSATLSGTSASLTTSLLPAGSVNLIAVYSGDSHNALSASTSQAVTVAPALISTATSLATTSTGLNQTIPANFTLSVVGSSGATLPTGSFTITANGVSIGSTTVSNGTASFSSTLQPGTNSIQASYSGDSNYLASTSNSISLGVVAVPDFTITPATFYAGINKSISSKITLTLTPQYGFNQTVSLSCSGQPANVSCSLSPATVTVGSGPVTSTVGLSFSGQSNQSSLLSLPVWARFGGGLTLALLLWPFRRRRIRVLLAAVALFAAGLTMSACGSNVTMQNIPVTITASGGGITHTLDIKLSVTQ